MGVKFPSCFPRGRRWRRNSKTGQQDAAESPPGDPSDVPEAAAAPRTRSTPSTSSETDPSEGGRAYFSTKARVSFRHQLDSERDATT